MKTLKNLFLEELKDRYYSEKKLVQILPEMIMSTTCENLRKILQSHIPETETQIVRIEKVFEMFDKNAYAKKCEAMSELIKEYEETTSNFKGTPTINAALIEAIQKINHYEIISYSCLCEWALVLDNKKVFDILQCSLEQEGVINKALTELVISQINQETDYNNKDSDDVSCSINNKKYG